MLVLTAWHLVMHTGRRHRYIQQHRVQSRYICHVSDKEATKLSTTYCIATFTVPMSSRRSFPFQLNVKVSRDCKYILPWCSSESDVIRPSLVSKHSQLATYVSVLLHSGSFVMYFKQHFGTSVLFFASVHSERNVWTYDYVCPESSAKDRTMIPMFRLAKCDDNLLSCYATDSQKPRCRQPEFDSVMYTFDHQTRTLSPCSAKYDIGCCV